MTSVWRLAESSDCDTASTVDGHFGGDAVQSHARSSSGIVGHVMMKIPGGTQALVAIALL